MAYAPLKASFGFGHLTYVCYCKRQSAVYPVNNLEAREPFFVADCISVGKFFNLLSAYYFLFKMGYFQLSLKLLFKSK